MDSASFATSSPADWVFGAFVVLGALVLALVLATVAVWNLGTTRSRRLARRREEWEEAVLELCGQNEPEERRRRARALAESLARRDREAFAVFVMEYLVELRGEDADLLRELLRNMEFDRHAEGLLASRSAWKRSIAARLLGEIPSPLTEKPLLDALLDPDPGVSFAAAVGILKNGNPGSLPLVCDALQERMDWPPGHIKELLVQGGAPLAAHLHRRLSDGDLPEARLKLVIDLLGHLRYLPSGETMLSLLRNDPAEEIRISLLRAVGLLELTDGLPDVLASLRHPNWVVRSQAALALGRIGDAGGVSSLFVALDDGSYWVRYNAAIALRSLGELGRRTLEMVAKSEGTVATLAQEVLLDEDAA